MCRGPLVFLALWGPLQLTAVMVMLERMRSDLDVIQVPNTTAGMDDNKLANSFKDRRSNHTTNVIDQLIGIHLLGT